ncbi:subtilase family N-terminal domain-containing protein, partial [Arthrospira platensis SPKY1]|nr:subtilase family N-terminal domain-containing protein [Arthrospira platensis SPKY1]
QNNPEMQVIRGERPPIDLHALTEDAYEKGIVLIKFNENSGKQLEDAGIKNGGDGTIRFGFENVDALCKQFSIGNAAQLFSSIASKNGFTTKHKAWGFDRWYKLKMDDQTDIIA